MLNTVFSRFVASFIGIHSSVHIIRMSAQYCIRMRVAKPEIHESEKVNYNHGKIKERSI